jgi:dCTP deaminase
MTINGAALLRAAPIKDMLTTKVRGPLTSHGLSEAGYDIRVKQDIHMSANETRVDQFWSNGRFALASTIEEFDMPPDMVGVVHDKSTWARLGLSVFNTVIENGFCGGLTIELVYHGSTHLYIPAGSGIAQVIFHQTISKASYSGKYQGQSTDPTHAIFG